MGEGRGTLGTDADAACFEPRALAERERGRTCVLADELSCLELLRFVNWDTGDGFVGEGVDDE